MLLVEGVGELRSHVSRGPGETFFFRTQGRDIAPDIKTRVLRLVARLAGDSLILGIDVIGQGKLPAPEDGFAFDITIKGTKPIVLTCRNLIVQRVQGRPVIIKKLKIPEGFHVIEENYIAYLLEAL